ncbi:MAG: Na/Pi cotransporter family protein [Clostridia bacterium]|nr:Na/Pi cotransporter family protein [Clostridia bacterium]
MSVFNILNLICGLALFLFGMNFMGDTLKKSAGNKLKTFLGRITSNPIKGFLLGMGVTAVIQSSSATTVMIVGFVNSGTMMLSQAISVIMGANVGTTVTSWLTGLSGIGEGGATAVSFLQWLKPSSFVPILALVGVLLYMLGKNAQRRNIGLILLGFSVLMVGMDMMSEAVKPLSENEAFKSVLLWFENPLFGVLAGMVMTAIIQSSSASVGILQSLTVTGAITFGNAVPILLGQNIGTCVTALISSIGTSRNAKRTAFVHFYFNAIGVVVFLGLFYLFDFIVGFPFMGDSIDMWGIAIVHTVFNIVSVLVLAPFSKLLEKLVCLTVRDKKGTDETELLDERLLATPSVAIDKSVQAVCKMADAVKESFSLSSGLLYDYDTQSAEKVRELEVMADKYEDMIGSYLLKLSPESVLAKENMEITKLLHLIGDLERISDHAVNIVESAEEIRDKKITFSDETRDELEVMSRAVGEVIDIALSALVSNDIEEAQRVEPLEQVIDGLREELKRRHIMRLQKSKSTVEHGFILSDILTNYERIADHCSNVAGCIIEISKNKTLQMHSYTDRIRESDKSFDERYMQFSQKYSLRDAQI